MTKNNWPKCLDCNNRLILSKVENDKWICKICNKIFLTEDVIFDNITYRKKQVYGKLGIQ